MREHPHVVEMPIDLPAAQDHESGARVEGAGSMKLAWRRRRFATTEVLQRDGGRRRNAARETAANRGLPAEPVAALPSIA